jgi:hypothetical protein
MPMKNLWLKWSGFALSSNGVPKPAMHLGVDYEGTKCIS